MGEGIILKYAFCVAHFMGSKYFFPFLPQQLALWAISASPVSQADNEVTVLVPQLNDNEKLT